MRSTIEFVGWATLIALVVGLTRPARTEQARTGIERRHALCCNICPRHAPPR
jgi:hypothetical protein